MPRSGRLTGASRADLGNSFVSRAEIHCGLHLFAPTSPTDGRSPPLPELPPDLLPRGPGLVLVPPEVPEHPLGQRSGRLGLLEAGAVGAGLLELRPLAQVASPHEDPARGVR